MSNFKLKLVVGPSEPFDPDARIKLQHFRRTQQLTPQAVQRAQQKAKQRIDRGASLEVTERIFTQPQLEVKGGITAAYQVGHWRVSVGFSICRADEHFVTSEGNTRALERLQEQSEEFSLSITKDSILDFAKKTLRDSHVNIISNKCIDGMTFDDLAFDLVELCILDAVVNQMEEVQRARDQRASQEALLKRMENIKQVAASMALNAAAVAANRAQRKQQWLAKQAA